MKISGLENNAAILKELGQRLKEIRIAHLLTQKDLANEAGVSFNTVVRIENGESITIENLMRVMRVLDLLRNFDMLVPAQEVSLEDVFLNKPKRKRVSKRNNSNKEVWIWGDEE